MATSVTISPSLGHALLFTQEGIGSTPGYDAIDLRRIAEAAGAFQEGVFDATGWKVTQRATGANMSVDVAANVGLAVVQGDSATAQSRYVVAPHSAVANLDIGANATGNPRVDQIVLQVRDETHDGSGQNDVRVLVLQGTATSGASLANRTGAASLPASALRHAYVLVASGASSITSAVIQDVRAAARPKHAVADITIFAGSSVPAGELACDGSAVSRVAYAALYTEIGTTYGSGDGSTTFNLPDLRGRAPVGPDGAAGRLASNDALGQSGGAEGVTLTAAQSGVPDHSHLLQGEQFAPGGGLSVHMAFNGYDASFLPTYDGVNGGAQNAAQAHNNLQPYQIVSFTICTGMAA